MTEIKIKRLELENFKCHKSLKLNFEGGNASIYGDNASGKTSIYDALTWLLFGKDSQGNGEKNIEIKPLGSDGEVLDHEALTAVEALLDVNGEEVTLRRTYREVWTTKRGSSEATYDGNTSEYYVDGVPVKKNGFQDKVNELVDEDTFRLLTSVSYFSAGISWQERRGILFKAAGVMDDREILALDERFKAILDGMGKLSLEDYKKKLLAEKKKFTGTKGEIPARISECERTVSDIEGLDFAGARAEVEKLTAKKEEISAQIMALDSGDADKKALEILEVELELKALENENKAFRDRQMAGSVDVHSLNIRLTALNSRITMRERSFTNEVQYMEDLDKQITRSREHWMQVNTESFAGGNCPTCGQNLPADQLQAAMEQFEEKKKQRLDEILSGANKLKETRAQAEHRFEQFREELDGLKAEREELRAEIAAAEANKVEASDMADYGKRKEEIQFRIAMLNNQLREIQDNVSGLKAKLRQEVSEISRQISEQMGVVGKEGVLDYTRQRIAQLREDAKNAAECLEAIEGMLFCLDEYSRYKTRFVEDSINGLFRIARFRLFREQANGGIEDRCDVVYDGIPYISVNNGMKINLGIDIINTLSAAYGVRVPLFVDNAESVTKIEKCSSQIIRLVVSENDKELRVSYEN